MVGTILLILLGILVVLMLIATIRTLRIKLPEAPKPLPADEAVSNRHAERLAEMIRVPSVSKNASDDLSAFYALHRVLERLFPLAHQQLERTELDGTLLYRWKGADQEKAPILFMAHQDVVPAPDEGWTHPPFGGEIVNGVLYGRGALDSKCNIYTQLEAVEQLLMEGFVPACDVYLEFSINEETGGDGAPSAVRYLKEKGVFPALVLDEGGAILDVPMQGMDRPYAVIGVGEKGYLDVKITAKGYGGHSSTPPRNTPIARLAAFVSEMERDQPFQTHLSREVAAMLAALSGSFGFGMRLLLGNLWLFAPLVKIIMPMVSGYGAALMRTTCTFTMAGGSNACNVIPAEAFVVANLRTSAHQGVQDSLAVLTRYAKRHDLELTILQQRDATPFVDISGATYAYVRDAIQAYFPDIGVCPYLILGGTDARHFYEICPACMRFAPIRMTSAQEKTCHGVDENVYASSLTDGVGFYRAFIEGYRPL